MGTIPVVPESPFVPKFITPTIKSAFGDTWVWTNSDWFLDDLSTQYLAKKFHAVGIEQRAVFPTGLYQVVEPVGLKQNFLVFIGTHGGGIPIPAGYLASYYLRWDPATAVILIWKDLKDNGVLVIGQ